MTMAKGRGSATAVSVAILVALTVALNSGTAEAATYVVGDRGGWTFNMAGWPRGKPFRAGDTLVFNYNPLFHNVVAVNRGAYAGCSTPPRSRIYTSGRDQITLSKGQNFFICNIPGHCAAGMKIAITAV